MIENLFATPIYYDFLRGHDDIKDRIDNFINEVEFTMNIKGWGNTHYISTKFKNGAGTNIIKELKLHILEKEIDDHIQQYCDEMNMDRTFLETFEKPDYKMLSWFSKFEKGNYAHIHDHGDADISGVYYYKTNNVDGDLFFISPNPHLDTSHSYQRYGEPWVHKPQEGKILLFPGWLKHGVRTNSTDSTRISLSFNIYFNHKR